MQMKTGLVMTFYAGKHRREMVWAAGGGWAQGGGGGGGRVAYNRFFFLEMSRKMRVPCDSGVKRVRIKKLNAIFGWIFAEK